jgi:CheY-like chemotaxis protein
MRIVLVDPSRAVQRAMTQLIEEGGHKVTTFVDGLEALAHIERDSDFRGLITSTQPLNISGIELCAAGRTLSGARRALHLICAQQYDAGAEHVDGVARLVVCNRRYVEMPPLPPEIFAARAGTFAGDADQYIADVMKQAAEGRTQEKNFRASGRPYHRVGRAPTGRSRLGIDAQRMQDINSHTSEVVDAMSSRKWRPEKFRTMSRAPPPAARPWSPRSVMSRRG